MANLKGKKALSSIRQVRQRNLVPKLIPSSTVALFATRLSDSIIRLTFSVPLAYSSGLLAVDNYQIMPPLKVLGASPQASVTPNYVDLTLAEQLNGQTYTIKVFALRQAAEPTLSVTFVGIGYGPSVSNVGATGNQSIIVDFSEKMTIDSAFLNPASYVLTAGVGAAASAIRSVTPNSIGTSVTLALTAPLTAGASNYTLVVSNALRDDAGNTITGTFSWPVSGQAPVAVNYCTQAIDRLPLQFIDKPKLTGWLCSLLDPLNEIEQAGQNILFYRNRNRGFGRILDDIGDNIGIMREGTTDARFRQRLEARALLTQSQGRPEEIIAILRTLDAGYAPSAISIDYDFPAGIVTRSLVAVGDNANGQWVGRFIHRAAPITVRLVHLFEESGADLFTLEEESAVGIGGTFEEGSAPGVGSIMGEAI